MKSLIVLLVIVAMSWAAPDGGQISNTPPHDGGVITNPVDPAFGRPSTNYPGAQNPSAGNGLYYPPPSYYDRGQVSGQNVPKYQVKPPGWPKKYSFPGARDGGGSA